VYVIVACDDVIVKLYCMCMWH